MCQSYSDDPLDQLPPRRSFERWTPRASQMLHGAESVANEMQHLTIGTRHLLIALLREDAGPAYDALFALGIYGPDLAKQLMDVDASW